MTQSKVQTPTKPDAAHIASWAASGWKHKGLGIFTDKHGHRGRLRVHPDGSTSLRILDFCAIQGDLRRKKI